MSASYRHARPEPHDHRPGHKAKDRSAVFPAGNRASYVVAARELIRFRLGDGRLDIRGWPVLASDSRLMGVVDRLMIEASSKKVRYIAVSLAREGGKDCKPTAVGSVLVPIGVVRRLDERQAVVLDGLGSDELMRAPLLRARAVTRADEDAALEIYGMPTSRELPAADFYKNPNFDESRITVAD